MAELVCQSISRDRGILRIGAHAQQTWELAENLKKAQDESALSGDSALACDVVVTAAEARALLPGLSDAVLSAAVTSRPALEGKRSANKQAKLRALGAPLDDEQHEADFMIRSPGNETHLR